MDLLSTTEQGPIVLDMLIRQVAPITGFTALKLSRLLHCFENSAVDAGPLYTLLADRISTETWYGTARQALCSGIHALKSKRKSSPAARSLLNKLVAKACRDFSLRDPQHAKDANAKFMLALYGAKLDSYCVDLHGASHSLMKWLVGQCIDQVKTTPRQRFKIIAGRSTHIAANEGKASSLVKEVVEAAGLVCEPDLSAEGSLYIVGPAAAQSA